MRLRLLHVSVLLLTLLPAPGWSWGPGRGGFHGGFGPPGVHGWRGGWGLSSGWHGGGSFFWGRPPAFVLHEHHFFLNGPAGLPPLGASGLAPGLASPPPRVFRAPFFCVAHGVEFQMKEDFFAHLQQAHGIPPEHAWSYCNIVSRWQIGFFGR